MLDNRKRDKLHGAKNLNNLLVGLEGDDELIGHVGDDYFIGGTGNDIINGAKGFDRAVYHLNKEAYIVTENGQRATVKKNPTTNNILSQLTYLIGINQVSLIP